ncbi:MAG TPA: hypothetical protein PK720_01775 [bacterium]|nr:hypothetical protein [bacterium]
MCFSASASFISGTILSSAGIATVKKAKKKKELPLALIPLLFGIQQLVEGLVWLSLNHGFLMLNTIATYSFVFFSHIFWPVFVPLAIYLIEPKKSNRRLISVCIIIGAVVSFYALLLVILFPLSSTIVQESIRYSISNLTSPFFAVFYVIATCGSCLLSSQRLIKILGMAILVSLMITYYFYTVTFASVWCFFAAILSLLIYLFFRQRKR